MANQVEDRSEVKILFRCRVFGHRFVPPLQRGGWFVGPYRHRCQRCGYVVSGSYFNG